MVIDKLISDLQKEKNPEKARLLSRFFKTGKGEYGEGDQFLGIKVPIQRIIAKKYFAAIDLPEIKKLLKSKIHEHRFTALIILMLKAKCADQKTRKEYFDFYLDNTAFINNWDLVDVTCRDIIGNYLLDRDRSVLHSLARSKNIWKKRIAIISTFAFIAKNDFKDSLKIAEILVYDEHDLIHKAVGWTLREIGKRNQKIEEEFLKKYYKTMPRTALRYAIEKFSKKRKDFYLEK